MTAYVYYSYEEFGRGYIGARSKSPDGDNYFGSFKDTTFKPTEKIVIAEYDTWEEALSAEHELHKLFDVAKNPHFANQVCAQLCGWSPAGRRKSDEHKEKIRQGLLRNWETQDRKERAEKTRRGMIDKWWDKELIEEIRGRLRQGKFRWGRAELQKKYGVGLQTMNNMIRLIRQGKI